MGIKIGRYHIYLPKMLKPKAVEFRISLWKIYNNLSNKNEIPKHIISQLGKPGSTWINSLVSGVFKASSDGSVKMDEEVLNIMNDLRKFMFEKVYLRDETKKEREEAKKIVEKLVLNFANNPDLLPKQYRTSQLEIENAVDYVAGMTDRFALKEFEKL